MKRLLTLPPIVACALIVRASVWATYRLNDLTNAAHRLAIKLREWSER